MGCVYTPEGVTGVTGPVRVLKLCQGDVTCGKSFILMVTSGVFKAGEMKRYLEPQSDEMHFINGPA